MANAFNLEEPPVWSTERTLSLWKFLPQRLLHVYLLFYQFLVCFTQFSHIPFHFAHTHIILISFHYPSTEVLASLVIYFLFRSVSSTPTAGGCDATPFRRLLPRSGPPSSSKSEPQGPRTPRPSLERLFVCVRSVTKYSPYYAIHIHPQRS